MRCERTPESLQTSPLEKVFLMSEQNNTKNQSSQNRLVRVVRIELETSKANVLKYIPSSFLPEISELLNETDELELHFKIQCKTAVKQRKPSNNYT